MFFWKKTGILQEIKNLYDAVLKYENDCDPGCAHNSLIIDDDYDVLSENSDTGGIIGFRNM